VRDFLSEYALEITEHRRWLKGKGGGHLKRWDDQLSHNPESAICEAVTRAFLVAQGVDVGLFEDTSKGGPDFLCSIGGELFHIEVTCVTVDKVTSKSHLSDEPHGPCGYTLLTDAFRGELSSKATNVLAEPPMSCGHWHTTPTGGRDVLWRTCY